MGDEGLEVRAASEGQLPKLIVFDLDACLWTPEMFELKGEPLFWDEQLGGVRTSHRSRGTDEIVRLFDGALAVMRRFVNDESLKDLSVAVASKTTEEKYAHHCLDQIVVDPAQGTKLGQLVHHREIYYGSKGSKHFPALKKATGFDYGEMVFFDDCTYSDNCGEVASSCPGIVCVRTPHGLTEALFDLGLAAFAAGRHGVVA
mmetsp:Transcript_38167/g.109533  ORF Transcript_38167/g.109533 Transcript_38167/m.109533 type:complete len:202 (+) Transcript_38167:137-742(+)